MFPIAFHPIYKHPLPEGHRFPMVKYELLPQQLLYEGTAAEADFFAPGLPDMAPVLAVHERAYVDRLLTLRLKPGQCEKPGFRYRRSW